MKYIADGPYHPFFQKPNIVQSSRAMDRTQNIDFSQYIRILCMLYYITVLYQYVITHVQLKMMIFFHSFNSYQLNRTGHESIDRAPKTLHGGSIDVDQNTLVDNERRINQNPCFTFLKKQFAHIKFKCRGALLYQLRFSPSARSLIR